MLKHSGKIPNVANMNEDMILLPSCWVVLVCAAGTLQLGNFVGQEEVELSNNIPLDFDENMQLLWWDPVGRSFKHSYIDDCVTHHD